MPSAVLAVLLACSAPIQAADNADSRLESGVYEGLMLAVDAQGALTGYYRQEQGEGVVKRCSFFLAGHASHDEIPIKTWREEVFAGTLQARGASVWLKIDQGRDHPGCGAVLLPEIATGLVLDRVATARWTALRRIVAPRGYFYTAPRQAAKQRSHVIQGDVVGVLAQRGGWLQVAYLGPKTTKTGWMRVTDSAALTPP